MLDNMSFCDFLLKKIQLIDSVNVEPIDPELVCIHISGLSSLSSDRELSTENLHPRYQWGPNASGFPVTLGEASVYPFS